VAACSNDGSCDIDHHHESPNHRKLVVSHFQRNVSFLCFSHNMMFSPLVLWLFFAFHVGHTFSIVATNLESVTNFFCLTQHVPHGEHSLFSYEDLLWQETVFVCRFSCKVSVYFCEEEFGNT